MSYITSGHLKKYKNNKRFSKRSKFFRPKRILEPAKMAYFSKFGREYMFLFEGLFICPKRLIKKSSKFYIYLPSNSSKKNHFSGSFQSTNRKEMN